MQRIEIDYAVKHFGRHTLWIGILLLLLGALGIALPIVLSELTIVLTASVMIAAGLLWVWHSSRHAAGWMDWIKPVTLLVVGCLIAISPGAGLAAVALLISAYLVLDAIAGFSLARGTSGGRERGWMIFNAVADILLAIMLLWGWPLSSLWMIGLLVGFSLLFDGWTLVMIGWSMK